MNGPWLLLSCGALAGALLLPLLAFLFRAVTVAVDPQEAVVVTRFGKLDTVYDQPGLTLRLDKLLPWTRLQRVSLRRDFRNFRGVRINDASGTSVMVDFWVEFRIVDPKRALFAVEDWDKSLQQLVYHASITILGNRDFRAILHDKSELGRLLQAEIQSETERWGIAVEFLFLRNVTLLPEVSRQLFGSVAARLRRARANVEELGRIRVAKLEAETEVQIAALVADAKGQYPAAIGRALERLRELPAVYRAYVELHELSLVRPHRTLAFRGFEGLKAADAAMIAPPLEGAPIAPLPSTDQRR